MTRRTAAVAAWLAALATTCACTTSDPGPNARPTTTEPTEHTTNQSSAPNPPYTEPIDMSKIPEGTPLEAATYVLPLIAGDGTIRAVVDVPQGYFGYDAVVDSGDGVMQPTEYDDLAFWGSVTRVHADACLGGRSVAAGTSVRDLARALVAQRPMRASRPAPVTIDGYHGLYLKLTGPADLGDCRDDTVAVFAAGGGSWLQNNARRPVFLLWILDVAGHRVVAAIRVFSDSVPSHPQELVDMVESARLIVADQS